MIPLKASYSWGRYLGFGPTLKHYNACFFCRLLFLRRFKGLWSISEMYAKSKVFFYTSPKGLNGADGGVSMVYHGGRRKSLEEVAQLSNSPNFGYVDLRGSILFQLKLSSEIICFYNYWDIFQSLRDKHNFLFFLDTFEFWSFPKK